MEPSMLYNVINVHALPEWNRGMPSYTLHFSLEAHGPLGTVGILIIHTYRISKTCIPSLATLTESDRMARLRSIKFSESDRFRVV